MAKALKKGSYEDTLNRFNKNLDRVMQDPRDDELRQQVEGSYKEKAQEIYNKNKSKKDGKKYFKSTIERVPNSYDYGSRFKDYSRHPLNIEGSFGSDNSGLRSTMNKNSDNDESTMKALRSSDFSKTKEISEKRPFDSDGLLAMALMQAGGALLGGATSGWKGAAAGSKAGSDAIQGEIERRQKEDFETRKLRMKEAFEGGKDTFGKGYEEMEMLHGPEKGKRKLFMKEDAYKLSQEGKARKYRNPQYIETEEGIRLKSDPKNIVGKKKPRFISVETPEGYKTKVSSDKALEAQKQGTQSWTVSKTGETIEKTPDRLKIVDMSLKDLNSNKIYTKFNEALSDIKQAEQLATVADQNPNKPFNFVAMKALINKIIRGSGDTRITQEDKKDFSNPDKVADSVSQFLMRKNKGRSPITLRDAKALIKVLKRTNKQIMNNEIVKIANRRYRSGKTKMPRQLLRDILTEETGITNESKPDITQNGYTYKWNSKTGKYE